VCVCVCVHANLTAIVKVPLLTLMPGMDVRRVMDVASLAGQAQQQKGG
jgi:hypothetical protein